MYPQSMFSAKIRKLPNFFIRKLPFLVSNFTAMKYCRILQGHVRLHNVKTNNLLYEQHHEKTCRQDYQSGPTQTLHNHRRWQEA